MVIIDDLLKERKKRERIFKNYKDFAKLIKKLAEKYFNDVEVYVFGSVVRGDYHVMLSDIDIAIITECEDKNLIYQFKAEVDKNFGDMFELHVMNRRIWKFYKKFIDAFVEIK